MSFPFFLLRDYKLFVVLVLALFVILARAYLCASLDCTVGVFEAPVADFKGTSLGMLCIFIGFRSFVWIVFA